MIRISQFPDDIVATVHLKKVAILQICTCIIGCFLFQTSTPTAPAPESASDRLHKVQQALKSNLMSTPSSEKSTINYNERRYEVRLLREPKVFMVKLRFSATSEAINGCK